MNTNTHSLKRIAAAACITCAFGVTPANAQSLQQTGQPARLFAYTDRAGAAEKQPYAPQTHESTNASRLTVQSSLLAATDTRMVFQSFRDGNWEIYRANGDGQNVARLTSDGASDVQPVLSPNGQRIAFASNRGGNFAIFMMDWDGANLRQLTSAQYNNLEPAWAPDNNALTFTTNRDGNYEIYVMSADGTNQRRITNDARTNFSPAWSVRDDLAWVTAQSSTLGAIEVTTLLSGTARYNPSTLQPLHYLDHLAWSPDGTRLAYDGAPASNKFNNVYVDQLELFFRPDGLFDLFAGSWSPDAQRISLTQVDYRVDNNQLVVIQRVLQSVELANSSFAARPTLIGGTQNIHADWRWNDSVPPVVQAELTFPGSAQDNSLEVTRKAQDNLSGLSTFLVDYQQLWPVPGPWTGANVGASGINMDTMTVYLPEGYLQLRVRARDYAGNLSASSLLPPVAVGIPFTGTLKDNRGNLLCGASVATDITPHDTFRTDRAGVFQVATGSNRRIEIRNPGYGEITHTFDTLTQQYPYSQYMAASDDVITNGRFESGLTGWTTTGAVEHFTHLLSGGAVIMPNAFGAPITETTGVMHQSVSVPANLINPTLALRYRQSAQLPTAPMAPLTVTVSSAQLSTIVYASAEPALGDFRHVWIDMSPWLGQLITVSLKFDAPMNPVATIIDDISISSWSTPFISGTAPTRIAYGASTTVIVTGTNFISTPTVYVGKVPLPTVFSNPGTELSATLPMTLPAGVHPISVMNPGGATAGCGPFIEIGTNTRLPLLLRN